MQKPHSINIQEDNDLKKVIELVYKNYKFFVLSVVIAISLALLVNYFYPPVYKISSSMLIKVDQTPTQRGDLNDYLNVGLFGANQNFQNELWVMKSSPVIEQAIKNLDLFVSYYKLEDFLYHDAYANMPFKVTLVQNHVQPVNVSFNIALQDNKSFIIKTKSKDVNFKYIDKDDAAFKIDDWQFEMQGTFGKLIETPELAFIIKLDTSQRIYYKDLFIYGFKLTDIPSLANSYKKKLLFNIIQKDATVVEINLKSTSRKKGKEFVNELMTVYSQQDLNRKNHLASITIDYIEKQLNEISDSLVKVENDLQSFRSSKQLLDITEQATGISSQYRDLQDQMAELVTRKRYYDYVADYLTEKEDFSEIVVPTSFGIQDPLLNSLIVELINAQAQRSNLIQNQQEKNPLVQKLSIQIANTRKSIFENIAAVRKTTDISIDELSKRIDRMEAEIGRIPATQRQLGGIEREYKLNDAIYNYLLEKRAEAKITKIANLPSNIIIEPAKIIGEKPIIPNTKMNFILAVIIGITIPFGYLKFKSIINDKIESQEDIEHLTDVKVMGKILHNHKRSTNVVFEFPKSNIAESYRALRTKLEYNFRGISHKVIMMTSCIEGEGKSFNALNLGMSYAQLGRRTILINFDLRKPTEYFAKGEGTLSGLSSYFMDRVSIDDIILRSPHDKLDYIPSGPLPPNPMELMASAKSKDMFDQLKDLYDCIILDTTPLAQVTDAYLLMEYADIVVVLARYNYSLKKVFSLIMKDLKQIGVKNVFIVINDNRIYRDQHGYGSGYNKKLS